ncbi:hypothetical protein FNV43_RR21003 [Rhamnella rubrinervis]|uniref:Disease resistance protein At4g27190-like leucine-rich repeats domain-containing protein n=1 Tax=Rhamnella rubrinervis TaxID=2594499 RepID=A0A8K0DVE8_9ROSA|nr:hypothetical protein FNV43_RR21003 [Rhamnella rubrinervis]
MEEARNRAHTLIQTLKRCFLLLDSNKRGCVKLHDVVRDVAISIASKKEHGFVVRCNNEIEEWPEIGMCENCTTISVVTNEIKKHLDHLVCPKLKLLHLSTELIHQQEFNDNFFRGMEKLEVLDFQKIDIQSFPSPLQVLQNMQTLRLENCVLKDISSIGTLVKLEILSLFGSKIQELLREIGHLQHLKLLNITECEQLDRIQPGVLSSLTRLEELYMYRSFSDWSPVQGNEERMCASVDELISLPNHLKVLEIRIPQVQLLGQSSVLFKNLTRFKIDISNYYRSSESCLFENYLRFIGGDAKSITEHGIHLLLNNCESLYLSHVKSLKNVTQLNEDGFSKSKVLTINNCRDVEYLINLTSKCSHQAAPFTLLEKLEINEMDNLKGLCHPNLLHLQRDPTTRFQLFYNLTNVSLYYCHKVQYVFSTSIARGSIPQLQSLVVCLCNEIEGVVYKETEESGDSNIVAAKAPFPPVLDNFNKLVLNYLPGLKHIWNITKKGVHQLAVTNGFQNLRVIDVYECGRLRCIFSPYIAKLLVMLEYIDVRNCESMQAIIDVAEEEEKQEENAIAFPRLRSIHLWRLGNLSCFCDQPNYAFGFPSLQSINIEICPKLETFVRAATMSAKDTPMLEKVWVDGKEIFDHEGTGDLNTTIHQNFQLQQEKLRQREKLKQQREESSKNSTPSVRLAANQTKSGFPPKTPFKTSSYFSSRLEAGMRATNELHPLEMVEHLRKGTGSKGQIVHIEDIGARKVNYTDVLNEISQNTISALKEIPKIAIISCCLLELANLPKMELIQNEGSPSARKLFILWNPILRQETKWCNMDFAALLSVGHTNYVNLSYATRVKFWRRQHLIPLTRFVLIVLATLLKSCVHHIPVFFGLSYLLDLFGAYQHISLFGIVVRHLMERDRRSIERHFFGRKLCGIAATNALELGIDVAPHLGFPAGRSSRRERPSLAVYAVWVPVPQSTKLAVAMNNLDFHAGLHAASHVCFKRGASGVLDAEEQGSEGAMAE